LPIQSAAKTVLGVITLEALGLAVDPGTGQLRESEVFLLAAYRRQQRM
jgi:predicted aspartyl protease